MLNMQNYLIKSLAIVGTISLIIMACSADDANNTNSTNAVGKYQISSYSNVLGTGGSSSVRYIDVIDTETGIVKSYSAQPNSDVYVLKSTTSTQ